VGKSPSWPVVTGPLAMHADGFRADLEERDFSCWAASRHTYVLDAVSRSYVPHVVSRLPGNFLQPFATALCDPQ
jgi:hypothetical protein